MSPKAYAAHGRHHLSEPTNARSATRVSSSVVMHSTRSRGRDASCCRLHGLSSTHVRVCVTRRAFI